MDVTSLYTNIPQEEGIETVCKAYDVFYKEETPIPTECITEKNAETHPSRKLVRVKWKKTTSKHMEQPWVLRWQSLLPTFLWGR